MPTKKEVLGSLADGVEILSEKVDDSSQRFGNASERLIDQFEQVSDAISEDAQSRRAGAVVVAGSVGLLVHQLGNLGDTITETAQSLEVGIRGALSQHGRSIETLGISMEKAGSAVGDAARDIRSGAGDVMVGMILPGILERKSKAEERERTVLEEHIMTLDSMFWMIKSMRVLERTYGPLRIEFVLERAYAGKNLDRSARKIVLNRLVAEGIVAEALLDDQMLLRIDSEASMLVAYRNSSAAMRKLGTEKIESGDMNPIYLRMALLPEV